MARVIGVHGIRQQFKGEETLRVKWLPALRDGLHRIGVEFPYDEDLVCAFYGRPMISKKASVTGRHVRPVLFQSAWLFSCCVSFFKNGWSK